MATVTTMKRNKLEMRVDRPSVSSRVNLKSSGSYPWLFMLISSVASLLATEVRGQELANESTIKRNLAIFPRLSINETWTDNVRADATAKQSDRMTEITPGVLISSDGAYMKGYLDYTINKIHYANNSSSDKIQNSLNGFGSLEAVENFLVIDINGNISQQLISALGPKSAAESLINDNQTEVSNFRISPNIKGQFLGGTNYEARLSRSIVNTESSLRSSVGQTDWLVRLNGDTPVKGLSWSADANRQMVGFSQGRPTQADNYSVGIGYAVTPQISISARSGVDANNYSSLERESSISSGLGVNWRISERSNFTGSFDQRSYGRSHSINLEHRTGRTAWKFSDSKSASTTPTLENLGSIGSIYDLVFNQFSTLEPNETARSQLVNDYLLINNLNPNTRVLTPFLTSAQTLARKQELLFALLGLRSTVTFIASQSRSQRLDTLSVAVDDFSTETSIKQQGLSINFSHRLAPDMSLSALASWQKNGSINSNTGDSTSLFSINLTKRIEKKSTFSTSYRRVANSGMSQLAQEAALSINLILLF